MTVPYNTAVPNSMPIYKTRKVLGRKISAVKYVCGGNLEEHDVICHQTICMHVDRTCIQARMYMGNAANIHLNYYVKIRC